MSALMSEYSLYYSNRKWLISEGSPCGIFKTTILSTDDAFCVEECYVGAWCFGLESGFRKPVSLVV